VESGIPFTLLGHVTRGKMVIDDHHHGFVEEVRLGYDNKIGELMS
jgi:phosphoribosylformylglycinamidine synthase